MEVSRSSSHCYHCFEIPFQAGLVYGPGVKHDKFSPFCFFASEAHPNVTCSSASTCSPHPARTSEGATTAAQVPCAVSKLEENPRLAYSTMTRHDGMIMGTRRAESGGNRSVSFGRASAGLCGTPGPARPDCLAAVSGLFPSGATLRCCVPSTAYLELMGLRVMHHNHRPDSMCSQVASLDRVAIIPTS